MFKEITTLSIHLLIISIHSNIFIYLRLSSVLNTDWTSHEWQILEHILYVLETTIQVSGPDPSPLVYGPKRPGIILDSQ